ncbi:MAG: FG-GAP-like repeat-containing protein [Acidobacteriota bacterium]
MRILLLGVFAAAAMLANAGGEQEAHRRAAKAELRKAMEPGPNSVLESHLKRAKAYRMQGHLARALEELKQVLETELVWMNSPYFKNLRAQAHYEKGTILQRMGERLKARTAFLEFLEIKPLSELLRKLAEESDPSVNIFLNQQRVEMFRAQLEQATDEFHRVIQRMHLPMELLSAGKPRQAIQEIRELQRLAGKWDTPEEAPILKSFHEFLALAYLRLGEQENCILSHTADSCLLPISESGVHQDPFGSRRAVEIFSRLLEEHPENLSHRWLLNIAYMTLGEYPDNVPRRWLIPPEVFESDYPVLPFQEIAPAVGLDMVGLAGGSILEDFDRDGFLDVMASSYGLKDQLRYFHNNGDGTFSDWSERSGLLGQLGGLNLIQGDYNNDNYPDVVILRGGWFSILGGTEGLLPNTLLRNNGNGTFTDVTVEAGILSLMPSHSAAFADYNLDGWLDLFIGNESPAEQVNPCQLFRNNGDGTFTDVAPQVALDHVGFVKGVAWGDYNNDGYPDLYISRFQATNLLFRNDGPAGDGWKFTEVAQEAGVSGPLASFPVWFWDFDNNGWEDLFVGSFSSYTETSLEEVVGKYLGGSTAETSRLYRNNQDGTFSDVTSAVKLDRALMVMGANYGDIDNDGFLDLYLGTGEPALNSLVPNRMFRNADGRLFQDVTTAGSVGHLQKGHGISFGDIDNDGDQDIYAVLGGAYSGDVYQNALFLNNHSDSNNRWITLRLEGTKSNRTAVGARIRIRLDTPSGKRDIYATVSSGGSFGASSLKQEIGLGQAKSIEWIEIRWPNSDRDLQRLEGIEMNQAYQIQEGSPKIRKIPTKAIQLRGVH